MITVKNGVIHNTNPQFNGQVRPKHTVAETHSGASRVHENPTRSKGTTRTFAHDTKFAVKGSNFVC